MSAGLPGLIALIIACDGTSWCATKTVIAFSMTSGILQAIGFALSMGYGAAGGKRCAVIWSIGVATSAYIALSYNAKVAAVDFLPGVFFCSWYSSTRTRKTLNLLSSSAKSGAFFLVFRLVRICRQ